jgi:hypothetical protein
MPAAPPAPIAVTTPPKAATIDDFNQHPQETNRKSYTLFHQEMQK